MKWKQLSKQFNRLTIRSYEWNEFGFCGLYDVVVTVVQFIFSLFLYIFVRFQVWSMEFMWCQDHRLCVFRTFSFIWITFANLKLLNKHQTQIISWKFGWKHLEIQFELGFDFPRQNEHTFHQVFRWNKIREFTKMNRPSERNVDFGSEWFGSEFTNCSRWCQSHVS